MDNFGYENGETNVGEVNVGTVQNTGAGLPVKSGFWNKFKSFWLTPITVELTPHQQKIENEINEFLNQEITFKSIHDFLFQEIKF